MKIRSAQFRVTRAAPVLTIVLLCTLPLVFPNRTMLDAAAVNRQRSVALAVDNAPYRIGHWVGMDMPVPPAAVSLLRPNAILSRRFQRIGEDLAIDVLLVHCTDARDMGGHYPPNCYPASGWSAIDSQSGRESELVVAGRSIPVRVYEFRRTESDAREVRMRVFDVFILPDGTLTPDIGQISKLSERRALSAAGVAQLQIVTRYDVDEGRAREAADEILTGMPQLLTELRLSSGGDNVWDQR